jgi:hypothetical protein
MNTTTEPEGELVELLNFAGVVVDEFIATEQAPPPEEKHHGETRTVVRHRRARRGARR